MRKTLLLLCAFWSLNFVTEAQEYFLPFLLKYHTNWFDGLPIVVDNFGQRYYDIIKAEVATDVETCTERDIPLYPYDAIFSINGEEVQNKDINEIERLCHNKDTLNIVVFKQTQSGNMVLNCTICQKDNHTYAPDLYNTYICVNNPKFPPKELKIFSDSRIDFVKYHTYDFLIVSDDPLEDQTVLEEFAKYNLYNLVRDTESPDIVITIAKSVNESVNSTYVPPVSQIVTTGSTTIPVYNYITHKNTWITKTHTKVHETEGFTKTTKTSDIYLEISILDVSKMAEASRTTPPIVWQMKYDAVVTDFSGQISDLYMQIARFNAYPFKVSKYRDVMRPIIGAFFDENNVVVSVTAGSLAGELLKTGDKILKIDGKDRLEVTMKSTTKSYYKVSDTNEYYLKNRNAINDAINQYLRKASIMITSDIRERYYDNHVTTNFGGVRTITILRDGKKMKVKGILFPFIDIDDVNYKRCYPVERIFNPNILSN